MADNSKGHAQAGSRRRPVHTMRRTRRPCGTKKRAAEGAAIGQGGGRPGKRAREDIACAKKQKEAGRAEGQAASPLGVAQESAGLRPPQLSTAPLPRTRSIVVAGAVDVDTDDVLAGLGGAAGSLGGADGLPLSLS